MTTRLPARIGTLRIGPRDIELLTAIDRSPLTPSQLCRLSETFSQPFADENNVRRRLRKLRVAGLLKSWPYATTSTGSTPHYFKLSRDGYRLLYGESVTLPKRRYFEAIKPGHHHHTQSLADVVTHTIVMAHRRGIELRQYARENSVRLEAGGYAVLPDAAFELATPDGRAFHFCVELDNGTERIRSKQDVESIERKLRCYDIYQSRFDALDPGRPLVLFVTTRSAVRVQNILDMADMVQQNRQRTVFVGVGTAEYLASDPFADAILTDHRGLKRMLIPRPNRLVHSPNRRQETLQSSPAYQPHHATV